PKPSQRSAQWQKQQVFGFSRLPQSPLSCFFIMMGEIKYMNTTILIIAGVVAVFYTFFPHEAHIWVAKKLTGSFYVDIPHQAHVAFGVCLGLLVLWQARKQFSIS